VSDELPEAFEDLDPLFHQAFELLDREMPWDEDDDEMGEPPLLPDDAPSVLLTPEVADTLVLAYAHVLDHGCEHGMGMLHEVIGQIAFKLYKGEFPL
jgi:hypothetical protein